MILSAPRFLINEAYMPLRQNKDLFLVLWGGAGSGKSEFAAQRVLERVMSEEHLNFLVVRKTKETVKNSVFKLLERSIIDAGLSSVFRINHSDHEFTHKPTGNRIITAGMNDQKAQERIKSITDIGSCWIEEATELTQDDLQQLILRVRKAGTAYRQFILTFNPINECHWLRQFFFTDPPASCTRHHSTFRDNAFIDQLYVDQLRDLKRTNPAKFRVYCQGQWGQVEGLIYPHVQVLTSAQWPRHFNETVYGIDFGYTHPATLIECNIGEFDYEKRIGPVYLRELIYESELTLPDFAGRMAQVGITNRSLLYADSEDPANIEELYRMGYDVRPARKGQNSVRDGILFMRSLAIYVHEESVNMRREFMSYTLQTDKAGKWIEGKPVKQDDHAMDAARYAVTTHLDIGPAVFEIDHRGFA